MAFQNFSFPQIIHDLELVLADADLFAAIAAPPVGAEFFAQVIEGVDLAKAINTEKARSEFIIAPILLELRRQHRGRFALFSGVEINADASRGLNGVCDFVLARSPTQHVMSAPLMAIIEAKNDNPRTGLGQCIAAMAAAQIINREAGSTSQAFVYGASTTGSVWQFLKLRGADVSIDLHEYRIDRLDKVLGILGHIVEAG